MEGVLQGGVGALLALLALGGRVSRPARPLPVAARRGDQHVVDRFLPVELCILLVVGGMAVGCLGAGLVAESRAVTALHVLQTRYRNLDSGFGQALH